MVIQVMHSVLVHYNFFVKKYKVDASLAVHVMLQ